MDRINKTGKLLIDYKREYMKHYSPIVDASLHTSVDTLVSKNVCDESIAAAILNDNIPLKEFEIEVSSKREFLKTMKELAEEFDKIRSMVNKSLTKVGFVNFVETENNIENDSITIIKQYSITPEFIKMYFGLTDDEMPAVMKKRGFAEKFAVLRLSKIFKEIISEIRGDNTGCAQGFSKVYYNQSIDGFSVDYRYHINVNSITEENVDSIVKKIREADKIVERKFNVKTGLKFYNLQPVEMKKEFLENPNFQPPKNKGTEELIDSRELEEIQNQLIKNNEDNLEKAEVKEDLPKKDDDKNSKKNDLNNDNKESKKENKKEEKFEQPKKEEKSNSPLEIKDEDLSPFDSVEEEKISIPEADNDETAVFEEEANNIKVEVDNSDDFLDGFIPQQVFSMGMDDVPGDDDFIEMNTPDDEDIDFT